LEIADFSAPPAPPAQLDLTNQMRLSKLTISSGILSPDFASAIDKYNVFLQYSVDSLTFTVAPLDSSSAVSINGYPSVPAKAGRCELNLVLESYNFNASKTNVLLVRSSSCCCSYSSSFSSCASAFLLLVSHLLFVLLLLILILKCVSLHVNLRPHAKGADMSYNATGFPTDDSSDLLAQLYVPFTLGPGDVTVEFTSDGRGLHSSTGLQINLSSCFH